MEVKDKPRNNSARKCVSGEAAQSSRGGRGKGAGLVLQPFLQEPCFQQPGATPGTLLRGNLRGRLAPADPTPTQPLPESELHLFWPDLLHLHSTETCAQSWD